MNGCLWLLSHRNCIGCPEGGDEGGCDLAGQDYSTDEKDDHENHYYYDDDDETTGWGGQTYRRKEVKCRYCKVGNLYWKQVNNKWKLFDYETNNPHVCNEEDIEINIEIQKKEDEIKKLKEKASLIKQKDKILKTEYLTIDVKIDGRIIGTFEVKTNEMVGILFKDKTYEW